MDLVFKVIGAFISFYVIIIIIYGCRRAYVTSNTFYRIYIKLDITRKRYYTDKYSNIYSHFRSEQINQLRKHIEQLDKYLNSKDELSKEDIRGLKKVAYIEFKRYTTSRNAHGNQLYKLSYQEAKELLNQYK